MADATFRDLCLDATEADALAAFWAAALDRTVVDNDDDPDVMLRTTDGARSGLVWINTVPEERTAKARAHLDLRMPVADPAALVALGATVLRSPDQDIHWWVMSDPEGNEFCAFGPGERSDPPSVNEVFELVVDAADPPAIANWWAERLGGTVTSSAEPWSWIEGAPNFPFRYWVFNPVPEPKTVKNRLHWDINLDADDPSALVAAGARVLTEPNPEADWWVLADPEGNEFCAFNPAQA